MYVPTHHVTFCGYMWVETTAPGGEILNLNVKIWTQSQGQFFFFLVVDFMIYQ